MYKEHFWFCTAKFKFYSKQEGGQEQMSMISSTGPMNAFYGNSQLLIGSINLSKTQPILLIVEVQIVQVQSKFVCGKMGEGKNLHKTKYGLH
jgi:hypothetical protein